ncbi:MAG TPA: HAD-IIIA family hydrolase [Solirubrobacteraceae bacterium]|nr:HAD-IIIA family hydrolase [Solirubrobacteraceae bacterium]
MPARSPSYAFDVVVPTIGRPTLALLLAALAEQRPPLPRTVVLVDDRPSPSDPLLDLGQGLDAGLAQRLLIISGPARGPAAARNAGWRATSAPWVVFLDDDVLPAPEWSALLAADLATAPPAMAGVQGRIRVPLLADRAPTDWERHVSGLEGARYATADMAYRRTALVASGGFDERFPRAYREDADLALRLRRAGWAIEWGRREIVHPVRPAGPLISLRLQAGNADDALMRTLHGPDWRRDASAPPGRLRRHAATVGAAAGAALLALTRRPAAARLAALAWLAGTAEFARARIAPGPRTAPEVAKMVATSVALPFWAVAHRVAGWIRAERAGAEGRAPLPTATPAEAARARAASAGATSATAASAGAASAGAEAAPRPPLDAVLLDRDGTLIEDVAYNGDPARVRPRPGAEEALAALRAAGVRLAVVSNQSGVGRGLVTMEEVLAVNRRVEELLGPLGPWLMCPHAPEAACECRKPRPGLVRAALEELGVRPERCAMIGDIGADVEAALAAGVRPVLVPTARTLPGEVLAAPAVACDLRAAVALLIGA